MAFTVAGTVTINGRPVTDGLDVEIWAFDGAGDGDLVATVQTTGGTGAFSATVPDNTRDYRAIFDDGTNRGISALGTPSGTVDARLIVIRGQSNAVGRADVGTADRGLNIGATFTGALIAQKTSDATTNPIGWDFDYAARDLQPYRASGSPGMGIELSAGRYLRTYVPAFAGSLEPYMDKFGVNGSPLASWWLPTTPDDASLPGPDNMFTLDMARIAAHVTASGYPVGAYIWIQGEADAANGTYASAYQANLTAFYDALLTAYPTIKFVFNKLHVNCPEANTATVRAAQVAFAAARPAAIMVDCDDIPLPAGDAHFAADSMVTLGNRLAEAAANALYPGRNTDRITSTAPFIQAINEPCDRGAGALTPRIPIHKAGDDLFLVVATGLLNNAPTTPSGWTLEANKTSTSGGNYANVYVYRKRATGPNTAAPSVADTNNLNVALCFVVRGGASSPIDVSATSANDAYNTTMSAPSVTTTGADRLVLHIAGGYSGDPNLSVSGWTNGALAGLAEYRDSAFNISSEGMFVAVAAGTKATAGATGTTAITPSNISINAAITIAVKAT